MSDRFPPTSPSSNSPNPDGSTTPSLISKLDAEVAILYDQGTTFSYKDAQGDPLGPFAVIAYTPDLLPNFIVSGASFFAPTVLTPRIRELAVFAVCAIYPTPYAAYAHSQIAKSLQPFPLTAAQITDALRGMCSPGDGMSEQEGVAFEVALQMARNIGRLGEEEWRVAERKLGRELTARIAHVVGFYLYACCVMRLGEVKMPPEGGEGGEEKEVKTTGERQI